jgi:hypothetical protein
LSAKVLFFFVLSQTKYDFFYGDKNFFYRCFFNVQFLVFLYARTLTPNGSGIGAGQEISTGTFRYERQPT